MKHRCRPQCCLVICGRIRCGEREREGRIESRERRQEEAEESERLCCDPTPTVSMSAMSDYVIIILFAKEYGWP